jgi:hypothetical protein
VGTLKTLKTNEMKNNDENTQAGSDCQERLVLPLWAEYGEGPTRRGDYKIKVRAKDGREKTITAWHNPGNGHWLADGKECGYVDIIQPPGEDEEWRITHWQNAEAIHGAG